MRDNEAMLSAYGIDGCGCQTCVHEVISKRPWPDNLMYPFIVCETCGNKRCPKATLHTNECTGSNEPGQAGSSYGGSRMTELLNAVDSLTLPVKVRVTQAVRPRVGLSHPGMGGNDTDVVSGAHTGAQRKGEA